MAGVAALFTREFFEASRRGSPGPHHVPMGAHLRHQRRRFARNRRHIPEHVRGHDLWLIGEADLLLIGRLQAGGNPGAAIELGFQRAAIAADFATVNVKSPFSILSLLSGDSVAADKYGQHAVETDDRLRLKLSGPRTHRGTFER